MTSEEEMTAAGMLEEEIRLLEREIAVARAKAEQVGFNTGQPMIEVLEAMEKAELDAREIAHDRFHNRMLAESKTFFDSLKLAMHMAKAKEKAEVKN